MIYFNQDYLDFFKELEQNNSKEWFDENRKRYEKSVKGPFKAFAKDLADEMQYLYPEVNLVENTSIIRINRDIRFSKDKTPYKIHNGVMITSWEEKLFYARHVFANKSCGCKNILRSS